MVIFVGWVIWRTPEDLPEDLVFHVNYLGGDMPTFALNFSRPGGQVIAQYYNFIRLGFEGFREIQQARRDVAMYTAAQIADLGPYEMLSDGSELPVFFFRLKPEVTNYTRSQTAWGALRLARVVHGSGRRPWTWAHQPPRLWARCESPGLGSAVAAAAIRAL